METEPTIDMKTPVYTLGIIAGGETTVEVPGSHVPHQKKSVREIWDITRPGRGMSPPPDVRRSFARYSGVCVSPDGVLKGLTPKEGNGYETEDLRRTDRVVVKVLSWCIPFV